MKYRYSYVNTAALLIDGYQYPEPFQLYLQKFFRTNKKYGSRDRRTIKELCYSYFRLGNVTQQWSTEEALNIIVDAIENESILSEYISKINYFKAPLCEPFSEINSEKSFGFRPLSWLNNYGVATSQLQDLQPSELVDTAFGGPQIQLSEKPSAYQIQDLSSQFICKKIVLENASKFWDVCSASGGKSIFLKKLFPKTDFYLSDIRPQILDNAEKRWSVFHKNLPKISVFDATSKQPLTFDSSHIPENYFDTILLDVPCTGSGTWFRNPEHFIHFDYEKLEEWTLRQKAIFDGVKKYLKSGGTLYYVTCSVFEAENDQIVDYIIQNSDFKETNRIYFNGLEHQSDSMFFVEFVKNN